MTQSAPNSDPAKQKRTLLIAGGVCLFFSIYLLIFLLPDFIKSLAGPELMTLAQAAEQAKEESLAEASMYVSFTDGEWQCDTIKYVIGYTSTGSDRIETQATELFLTNASGEVVVLAQMSGELDCADFDGLSAEGYVTKMTSDRQQELTNDVRLARFINGENYLELCGYCGQTNSLIGTLFGFAFLLGALALLYFGWRIKTLENDPPR
ncbi:MAG: hypothetical protein AB8G95_08325 [Anaerolineae bacterium]